MAFPQILTIIAGPIVELFKVRTERRKAKDALKSKAIIARDGQAHEQTLTDAEWEVVMASQMSTTWKDEYALIAATLPYLLIFGGAVWYAVTGDYRMIEGSIAGITALEGAGVDVGFITEAAILAALGLSVWRKL